MRGKKRLADFTEEYLRLGEEESRFASIMATVPNEEDRTYLWDNFYCKIVDRQHRILQRVVPSLNEELSYSKIATMFKTSINEVYKYGKYGGGFSSLIKSRVKERDEYKCKKCKKETGKLDVHHKGDSQDKFPRKSHHTLRLLSSERT